MATRSQNSRPASSASKMSESRRERLMDIQKREQLKGMLVNKFKLKYGNPQMTKYIDNEVQRFLKNGRLTEDNLKSLDTKINKEAELRMKKQDILDDRKSERAGSQAGSRRSRPQSVRSGVRSVQGADDVRSVASSRRSSQGPRSIRSAAGRRDFDGMSVCSSQAPKTEVYSEIAEDDEWTAIQKFNTLLHYEEQKQAIMREAERKRLIRQELDRQLQEKVQRKQILKGEDHMYEALQKEHVKLLGEREIEKAKLQKEKVMQEKIARDRQLAEEKQRKRRDEKNAFKAEVDLVARLQAEMEQERKLMNDKREQERAYLQKMLQENEITKAKAEANKAAERDQDIAAQEEYARMLDQQEADRQREFEQREKRAQDFMNRLASGVIAQQQDKRNEEDKNLQRYEMEREMRLRAEDERRLERARLEKEAMKAVLYKQMMEKRQREASEKALNDEQAVIWARDKQNYEEEERRLGQKIKQINQENYEFLQRQMYEKETKGVQRRMNRQEFQLNKPLLKEINAQRKDDSRAGSAYH